MQKDEQVRPGHKLYDALLHMYQAEKGGSVVEYGGYTFRVIGRGKYFIFVGRTGVPHEYDSTSFFAKGRDVTVKINPTE